jgi:formylmethanofuran dehydrogenase subunit C
MLTLRCKPSSLIPVEAECIRPDSLAGMSPQEVAHLPVQHGNAQAPLGDFFTVEGSASDGEVVIEGDASRVKLLGAGMAGGKLTIRGNAGMHVGAEMSGGVLEVHGDAGDWAGAEMSGGLLYIHGNAGHLAGAAYRGARRGMRGGEILIRGSAGNEVGAIMRRGLIAVGGSIGDFVGGGMIAGTILVGGAPGQRPGAGMKRGTLAFLGEPPALLPTFKPACVFEPVFLTLYLRHLAALGFDLPRPGVMRRWCGDLVSLGKGEVLTWAAAG